MAQGTIHVTTSIPKEVHKQLKEIAKDRNISLEDLIRAMLAWGGGKSVEDLVRYGVRLPVFTDEFARLHNRKAPPHN